MTSSPLLEVKSLSKRFNSFAALSEIDFTVQPGERIGLIGPNGSGKSTFVNCVAGALRHDVGSVRFAGHTMDALQAHQRARLGLARSFQLPRPFPSMSVAQNLRIPLIYSVSARSGSYLDESAVARRVAELLDLVGLKGKGVNRPIDLTQVDLRKLDLARAMATGPRLLIADEAMAGLSHSEVDSILALLFRLNAEGVAVIMIEHIMRAVTTFSERLVVFVTGRKIADGLPREVIKMSEVERAYLGE
jgi:branched-chain amino acid transport system ATP-binding protein